MFALIQLRTQKRTNMMERIWHIHVNINLIKNSVLEARIKRAEVGLVLCTDTCTFYVFKLQNAVQIHINQNHPYIQSLHITIKSLYLEVYAHSSCEHMNNVFTIVGVFVTVSPYALKVR